MHAGRRDLRRSLLQDPLRRGRDRPPLSGAVSRRYAQPPAQIVLDLDATDDPLHGEQEGRFFHGYYRNYCYLPLYIFCGDALLLAKLRRSNRDGAEGAIEEVQRIVTQIRTAWPTVEIVLRADSGFTREPLLAWCEANAVEYVFGLARNRRLQEALGEALGAVREEQERSGEFSVRRSKSCVIKRSRPGAASGASWA